MVCALFRTHFLVLYSFVGWGWIIVLGICGAVEVSSVLEARHRNAESVPGSSRLWFVCFLSSPPIISLIKNSVVLFKVKIEREVSRFEYPGLHQIWYNMLSSTRLEIPTSQLSSYICMTITSIHLFNACSYSKDIRWVLPFTCTTEGDV